MKKLVMLAVAALGADALFGGTQVTEKMLADAIAEVKRTSSNALLDYALDNLNAREDNKLYYDTETGLSYCFVPEVRDGAITNVRYNLRVDVVQTNGVYSGCVVTSSSCNFLPVGTLFAGACTQQTVAATNDYQYTSATGFSFTVRAEWFKYGKYYYNTVSQSGAFPPHGNIEAIGKTDRGDLRLALTIINGQVTNRCHIVVEPIKLLKETWERIRGEQVGEWAEPSNWDSTGHAVERGVSLLVQQLPFVSARKNAPRRLGASADIEVISLPVFNYPAVDRVDSFLLTDNEEITEEEYWANPETWYYPDDWNEILNWFDWSAGYVIIVVQITQPSGRTFKDKLKVYPDEIANYWEPPPWTRPTFTKKTKQCENENHIYINCKCKYCGTERDHDWLKESNDNCARCQNHNTVEEYDERNDIWVPNDEEEGDQCKYGTGDDYPCTSDDENDHGGWKSHGEDEDYYCQCACGYFAENHTHKYVGDEWTEWSQYDKDGNIDGVNHWANLLCSLCAEQKKWKGQKHEKVKGLPEGQDEYKYTPIDADFHETNGKCNDCDWVGFITEEHMWKEGVESGKEMCWCEGCKDYFHHYGEEWACGSCIMRKCVICETTWRWGVLEGNTTNEWIEIAAGDIDNWHTFGLMLDENDPNYDLKHKCMCGARLEDHQFNPEHTKCLNALCHWHPKELYKFKNPYHGGNFGPNSRRGYSSPSSISSFNLWKQRANYGIIDDIRKLDPTALPTDPCQVTMTIPTATGMTSVQDWGWEQSFDYFDWKLGQLEEKFDEKLDLYFNWREIGSTFNWLIQWKDIPLTFNTRFGEVTTHGWSKSLEYSGEVIPTPYKGETEEQSEIIFNGVMPQEFDGNWDDEN